MNKKEIGNQFMWSRNSTPVICASYSYNNGNSQANTQNAFKRYSTSLRFLIVNMHIYSIERIKCSTSFSVICARLYFSLLRARLALTSSLALISHISQMCHIVVYTPHCMTSIIIIE